MEMPAFIPWLLGFGLAFLAFKLVFGVMRLVLKLGIAAILVILAATVPESAYGPLAGLYPLVQGARDLVGNIWNLRPQ